MSLIGKHCHGLVMDPCYWLVGLPVGLECATGFLLFMVRYSVAERWKILSWEINLNFGQNQDAEDRYQLLLRIVVIFCYHQILVCRFLVEI